MGEARRRRQVPPAAPQPGEVEALTALIRQGAPEQGEAAARSMTERFPAFGLGWKALGVILKQRGEKRQALAAMLTAASLLPDDGEVHFNAALIQQDAGQLDAAAAGFRRALELAPEFTEARIQLGNVLHRIVGKNSGKAFFERMVHSPDRVREQYENLPFPSRDPEGERYVMRVSLPDTLAKINQYCFGGRRDFSRPFRVFVAGCGTGDSAIWLGHQLQGMPAEIVALDISQTSLEVGAARAQVRKLTNIRWLHGSLLDVASMGLGKFDYITSLGVLHHLPDPVAGLRALESVLAEDGAMALMLYGAVGRAHIYAMQNVLRQLTTGIGDPSQQLLFAQQVVADLPATNGFRKHEGMDAIRSEYLEDDTNFWDTLLHAQDRAYTAAEIRDYLATAGLNLLAFTSYQGVDGITSLQYDLDLYIRDPQQQERLRSLPQALRENLAEALDGSMALHTVYASRCAHASLDVAAPDAILMPASRRAQRIIAHLCQSDQGLSITLRNGLVIPYRPAPITRSFFAMVDGRRSNAEIFRLLGIETKPELTELVAQQLTIPAALHWVLARTAAGSFAALLPDRTVLTQPLRHAEPTSLPL